MKKRIRKKDFTYITAKKYDGMMGRCYRQSDRSYNQYGGRGIKVCKEWILSIDLFRQWVKDQLFYLGISEDFFVKNSKKYQIDRINTNGHYTKQNCRIVDQLINKRNKTNRIKRVIISAEGDEVLV